MGFVERLPISEAQNRAAITDDSLAELAEAMGVDCVHLDDLTAEHAELAILGVALYPYLEPAGQNVIDGHIAGLPRGCRAAFRRARERHGRGAVIYENDSGSQRIVEGQSFDWDRLGILTQRTEQRWQALRERVYRGEVVADEVRKLAENTREATTNITNILQRLQSEVHDSATSMDTVMEGMTGILGMIENTDSRASQIAASAEELAATMSETTDNIGEAPSNRIFLTLQRNFAVRP